MRSIGILLQRPFASVFGRSARSWSFRAHSAIVNSLGIGKSLHLFARKGSEIFNTLCKSTDSHATPLRFFQGTAVGRVAAVDEREGACSLHLLRTDAFTNFELLVRKAPRFCFRTSTYQYQREDGSRRKDVAHTVESLLSSIFSRAVLLQTGCYLFKYVDNFRARRCQGIVFFHMATRCIAHFLP